MAEKQKPTLFMGVYNVLACDGRVQRAAAALAEVSSLTLLGLAGEQECQIPAVQIHEIRLPRFLSGGPTRLFFFWLAFVCKSIKARPRVVYAHDFFLLLPGWLASRVLKAKLVYDAHELIVPDAGRYRSFSHRVFYGIERLLVKRADLVIAANEARAEIMRVHYRLLKPPLIVRNIPIPVSEQTRPPVSTPETLPPSNGSIRLIYQGAMSLARGIDLFIKVLPRLGEEYELIMVGDGPDLKTLKEIAKQEGVESRVSFLGRVSTHELAEITRRCSVGIVSYSSDDPNERLCAPNKVYEYAQAGIPMVGTSQRTLQELVADGGIGTVIRTGGTHEETMENCVRGIDYVVRHSDSMVAHMPEFLRKNNWTNEKSRLAKCFEED